MLKCAQFIKADMIQSLMTNVMITFGQLALIMILVPVMNDWPL